MKTANIVPGNVARGLGSIQGAVNLYDDQTGALEALVDFLLGDQVEDRGGQRCWAPACWPGPTAS